MKSVKKRFPFGEIDIYIEQLNVGFEINGTYWHSDKFKESDYHQQKALRAREAGINLIHLYEWQLQDDIFLLSLLRKFKKHKKIAARKCVIRIISSNDSEEFCAKYHLSGSANCSVRYGLFFNEELIQVMTFRKPRFNSKYEWELIRLCTKSDITVIGGASKLLRKFETDYKPSSLISYSSLDYSNGAVYVNLGMSEVGVTVPGYWYIGRDEVLPRYKATKQKLNKILGTTGIPEKECAKRLKMLKVTNAGNLIFAKSYQMKPARAVPNPEPVNS